MNAKILAIDTSTDAYSVACNNLSGNVIEHFEIAPYKHSLLILDAINKILTECNLSVAQLDCVAFTYGPGSFTGLRLAASIVQGLAVAHNLPVVLVSTLQAMAQGAFVESRAEHVLVGIDARMHEIYWGAYSADEHGYMQNVFTDMLIAPAKTQVPPQFIGKSILGIGNAWEIYKEVLCAHCGINDTKDTYPHARYVLQLAQKAYSIGSTVSALEALPIYLRDEVAHKPKPVFI